MSPTEPPEHRHFSRIPLDSAVRLLGQDRSWDTELLDISLKGALVRRPDAWSGVPDEPYTVEIALSPDQSITMDARVAHVEPDRIGFRCEHIDVDSITHLRRIIELNTGDPQLLERELAALGAPTAGDR